MTHSGEKPFGCAYCDKKFIFSNQKKEHERIDTKPFICSVCNMKFRLLKALRNHVRIHSGINAFIVTRNFQHQI